MTVTFEYGNKTYTTNDIERKLRKMGLTMDDITVRKKQDCRVGEIDTSVKKYIFHNRETGETVISIYDNLDHLKGIVDIDQFELQLE